MKLRSDSFDDFGAIPEQFAFAATDDFNHIKLSGNRNPHLSWDDPLRSTRSYTIICHDPDVPSIADDVNREGRVIQASLPRIIFYHWVMFDIPADTREILSGSQSSAVTAGGKPGPAAPGGFRHGLNDYSNWFRADPDMSGEYYGYDGPCPPWNDELLHRYVFTIYALDIARLDVTGKVTGGAVLEAMTGHILDAASITGVYTLNPDLLLEREP